MSPLTVGPLILNEVIENNFLEKYRSNFDYILSDTSLKDLNTYFNVGKDEKTAKSLWKNLIIDAISFLKINDSREKLFLTAKEKLNGTTVYLKDFFDNYEKTRIYNCYGIEDLDNYFKDFLEFESVLYGSDGNYRDHVNHVIYVWSIGLIILSEFKLIQNLNVLPDKSPISYSDDTFAFLNPTISSKKEDSGSIKEKLIITKGEIIAAWTIIALCHDLGYPIEKASKINEKLKMIINHFGQIKIDEFSYNFSLLNSFLIEKFLQIISSKPDIKNRFTIVQEKYKDKLSKGLEDYKHGVFSSLLIYKSLTYFIETDYSNHGEELSYEDLRQFFIRREILRSIAAHTSPKLYHLNIRNLAFLLFISDELNEWGRPSFDDFKSFRSKAPKTNVYITNCEFNDTSDKLEVTIEYFYENNEELEIYNIKRKFRVFYHLLRTAKDDEQRKFMFSWTMNFNWPGSTQSFVFKYDASQFPNAVSALHNGSDFKFMELDDKI